MALPIFYPFKTRHYQATAISSNGIAAVPVVARGKVISVSIAPLKTDQTATGAMDIAVNGSTATGLGAVAISTGVAGVISYTFAPTAAVFVGAGDVLSTVSSSVVATNTVISVQEF